MNIAIIDYDCGNIQSLTNAIEYLGYEVNLVNNPNELYKYNKLILPGVGSFDSGVSSLLKTGLFDEIINWVENEENKLLGICLGMQLLCNSSEESSKNIPGLSLIDATVKSLSKYRSNNEKVPHIGWNNITLKKTPFKSFIENTDFYFVHSFAVFVNNENLSLAKTPFSHIYFDSIISNNRNIFGMQFHPEKSHIHGLNLLEDFFIHA